TGPPPGPRRAPADACGAGGFRLAAMSHPREAKLQFSVSAERVDAHGSTARTKRADIVLDTDLRGREDAFNPAELLLAALAACIIKGVERVAPIIGFRYDGLAATVAGVRQDVPPRMDSIH